MSDVQRAPRLVAWSGLILEVGIHAKGEGENPSNSSGVQGKTQRLVAWLFMWFLVLEESKIDARDSTGYQMKVPRIVV